MTEHASATIGDPIAAHAAELLAAAEDPDRAPGNLNQVRAELREVFWVYGLHVDDLTVARTGLAVLWYLANRADAAALGGAARDAALASVLTTVATVFAELNPQPIPAHRVIRENIIRLPDEDTWWEVDWRRPGIHDGQVTLRVFEARPAAGGWKILATAEFEPRTLTVPADTMVLRA
jgi:hypothetical protein